MNKGQTLKGMNISNGMEWNECETEKENIFIFKETKLKRILPQWIMEGINFEEKKQKISTLGTEKITCAKPIKKIKNEKLNAIKIMFEKKKDEIKANSSNPNCVKDEGVGVNVPPPVTSNPRTEKKKEKTSPKKSKDEHKEKNNMKKIKK